MSQTTPVAPARTPVRFAALRYPTFRDFWLTNTFSAVGNSMEIPIRGWLVWTLSASPFMLALTAVAHWTPHLLLSLYAGVIADRVDRRQLLAATQIVLLVTTLWMALLVYTGWANVWWIIGLTFAHGVAGSLGQPVRLTLVSDIVHKDHIMNAIALNSTAQQIASFVGPAIGGLLVGYIGMGGALVVNSLTYVPYIVVLFTMSVAAAPFKARTETLWRNLAGSFRYMRQNPTLLSLVLVIAIPSIFSTQTNTLMPVFVNDILHVGPTEFGLLLSASGLGALVAGMALSWVHEVRRKGMLVLTAALLSGLFMVLFGVSPWFGASLVFLIGVGASRVVYSSLTNTVLQVTAPDDMRGRVMGFFTWGSSGLIVLGSLQAGFLAEAVGAPGTMAVAGIATMLAVPLALWLAPTVRHVR